MPVKPYLIAIGIASGIATSAHANLSLVNYDGFEIRNSGNVWTISHETPESTKLRGGTVFGRDAAAVSNSSPLTVQARGKIPVGTGAVVDVTAKFTKPSFAKAFVASAKIAGRIGGGVVGGLLVDAALDYGISRLRVEDGELKGSVMDEEDFIGTKYIVNNIGVSSGWKITLEDACDAWASALTGRNGYSAVWITRYLKNDLVCHYSFTYNGITGSDGLYVTKKTNEGTEVKEKTIGEQEIADKIAQDSGWPTTSARALQGILGEPDARHFLEPDGSPNIVGPTSVPGQKSTKTEQVKLLPGTNTIAPPGTANTDPGTKTTTSTETHKLGYAGNNVTTITNVTNITNITNNITNVTTEDKSEEQKENDKEDESIVDTPLGELPKLYEKKYKEGLSGVWRDQSAKIKDSGLFSLAQKLMPTSMNAGTCPSFTADLSIANWANFGSHDVAPPCWIWGVLKAITLVSALILARRLIFGG